MNKSKSSEKSTDNDERNTPPESIVGRRYEVIESVGGQTLREYLQQYDKLSEDEFLLLARNIFVALKQIHSKGFIHNDIKPENILVTIDKRVFILDFGLSKTAKEQSDGSIVGTLPYMPAEKFAPAQKQNFDVRSDIYSLGVTLYELLTKQWPYKGHSPAEFMSTILANKKHIPISELRPDISSKVAEAVEKALEFKLEDRWNSVDDFWLAMTDTPLKIQINNATEIILAPFEKRLSYPILTPHYLATVLSPYLNAIVEIQTIINQARKLEHREVSISLISQKSPISVSLDGASEAIRLIKETVVPWRRKHAETMARLLEQEKQAEIESKKAEILEKRAHAEKERAESSKQREEAEKLRLENEKLRLELQRAKIQLAIELITQITPNLSEPDKIAFVVKMLPPLDVLIFNELEISGK